MPGVLVLVLVWYNNNNNNLSHPPYLWAGRPACSS